MMSNKIKIICTAEEKDALVSAMNGDRCPFANKQCTEESDCSICIKSEIDWEIVEPVKDFNELTIAEFEKYCDERGGCSDCAYLKKCAYSFLGRTAKCPQVALLGKISVEGLE